ncbi:MAG TPA: type I polyketide synthase, partial [Candidatus Eisenbacteria bacterium]|nr:type I polyketide synthase [Candidatus Eisenbacteria bacterium]
MATENRPWPETGRPRRAAVSSFGISGTNAHLILEQAPAGEPVPVQQPAPAAPGGQAMPWLLSARTPTALRAAAANLHTYLTAHPGTDLADVACTLSRRPVFPHRAAVVASGRTELLTGLRAVADGAQAPSVVTGVAADDVRPVFVFPGQGSQWAGMAVDLFDAGAPAGAFRARLVECDRALAALTGWSVLDVLRGADGAPSMERVDVVQPVLFAVMAALAGLWRAWGVEPAVVVGHSQGEIVGAHVSGALDLADAARVVALRSRALRTIAGAGGMASVPLPADQVAERLAAWPGRLTVAAINGPATTVVSGTVEAIDELVAACAADDLQAKRIPVDYASHSAAVEGIEDELMRVLDGLRAGAPDVVFHSTLTGAPLAEGQPLDATYWYRNLREPVRFGPVVERLIRHGHALFVEVSPHPVLTVGVQDCIDRAGRDQAPVVVGSLLREQGGWPRFLTALAEAYVHGAPVAWSAMFPTGRDHLVELPTYPFEGEWFWLDRPSGVAGAVELGLRDPAHPVLDAVLDRADGGVVVTGRLSSGAQPWLDDHAIRGVVLLPGTAVLELVAAAGGLAGCPYVEELTLDRPLAVAGDEVRLQVVVAEPDEVGRRTASLHGRPATAGEWVRHAVGVLSASAPPPPLPAWPPPPEAEQVDVAALYDRLSELGYEYGPAFQGVEGAWRAGDQLYVQVRAEEPGGFRVHPAALDAILHPLADPGPAGSDPPARGPLVPFVWTGVALPGGHDGVLRARLSPAGPDRVAVSVVDGSGATV